MGSTSMSKVNATSEKTDSTVVLADDHMIVRNALREIVASIKGARVVAEASDGLDAITLCKTHAPDFLTLDSVMPLARGMEVYGEVRRWSPATRICLVTGGTARGHLAEWIDAGVDGIAFKSCPEEDIRQCFSQVLQGSTTVTPSVKRVMENLDDRPQITMRERQILHLLAEGNSNAEIAERLSISPKTVDNHRTRLMAKLGVHSIAQLLAYALREGLL